MFNALGIKLITRLRLGLSHLRDHKSKHCFQDSIIPLCSCNQEVETTTHYFLHCPLFTNERCNLLNTLHQIDNTLLEVNDSNLVKYLLFGDTTRDDNTNTEILNATIHYVLSTKRFDGPLF